MARKARRFIRDHFEGEPRSERERARELQRLIALWPSEISDTSTDGRARLIAKLHRALRAERQRGLAGHWTYDLARHAALLAAWRRERAALAHSAHSHFEQKKRRQSDDRRPRNP